MKKFLMCILFVILLLLKPFELLLKYLRMGYHYLAFCYFRLKGKQVEWKGKTGHEKVF